MTKPWAPIFLLAALRAAAQTPAPMDLVPTGSNDPNGNLRNPEWGIQKTQPGSLGDPQACFNYPGWFSNPLCSTQSPSLDKPSGLNGLVCSIGSTTPMAGHVNWFPGVYTGPIYWDSQATVDRDYNMTMPTIDRNGLTLNNSTRIKGEFDARETVNYFTSAWWKAFAGASSSTKKVMVDGKEAIMAGLVGVDCEHDCKSEVHPVWALAVHVKNDPNDDVWAVFARNWGNEGYCSSQQHLVDFPGHRFTFALPWRTGATSVTTTAGTAFYANKSGMSYWWGATPGQKVSLTIQLLAPSQYGRVHGELHLKWNGSMAPDLEPLAEPPPVHQGNPDKAERFLGRLIDGLTPAQRAVFEAELAPFQAAPAPDAVVLFPAPSHAEEPTPVHTATVTSLPDEASAQANARRVLALRRAYGGPLPGAVGDAIETWLEQNTR